HRQPRRVQQELQPVPVVLIDVAQLGSHYHPGGDCLAVQPFAITKGILDSVRERVTEVQKRSSTLLGFVLGDNGCLDLARSPDCMSESFGIFRQESANILLEPGKETGVCDRPMLYHFGEPCTKLPLRKACQRVGIYENEPRLVECPDEVLAPGVIDAGLAADGGVYLRKQRSRHLDESDAAHVAGRREPRDVAHYAAAQSYQCRIAARFDFDQPVEDGGRALQRLPGFAVRQQHGLDVTTRKVLDEPLEIERPYGLVADDEAVRAWQMRGKVAVAVEQGPANDDGVTAIGQVDRYGSCCQATGPW